jgi:hypothetical protein
MNTDLKMKDKSAKIGSVRERVIVGGGGEWRG